jgi:uncharacterized small protein (DUF1192 family)
MRDDQDLPRGQPQRPLDLMSITELEAEIATHEARIAVLRAEIAKKQASRAAADAIFGRPPA